MIKYHKAPIVVVVANGEYNCYGQDTNWSRFLVSELKRMGGINEQVEDGCYHFNIEGTLRPRVTLTRFEDVN